MYYSDLPRKSCPVCDKRMLKVGIRNHIIGRAKGELYRWYFDRRENRQHLDFIEGNTKVEEVKVVRLKID